MNEPNAKIQLTQITTLRRELGMSVPALVVQSGIGVTTITKLCAEEAKGQTFAAERLTSSSWLRLAHVLEAKPSDVWPALGAFVDDRKVKQLAEGAQSNGQGEAASHPGNLDQ